MPFPANWLEELVLEWLDLLGFTTSTRVFVSAAPGGRWAPDVVGAKLVEGKLVIRHCEATMWLIQGPKDVAKKFAAKFHEGIKDAVRNHFVPIFGEEAVRQATYEEWVITYQASKRVEFALSEAAPGVQLRKFNDFVLKDVLPAIEEWRQEKGVALPPDFWLLQMMETLRYHGLLATISGKDDLSETSKSL